jgi:hypothetical protein
MSEVWNVGKDVISAYLSGLQHKERREALINQALYRQQQNEIAQQKIDEARKKFQEEHDLATKQYQSQAALRNAQMNDLGVKSKIAGVKLINDAKGNLINTADPSQQVDRFRCRGFCPFGILA